MTTPTDFETRQAIVERIMIDGHGTGRPTGVLTLRKTAHRGRTAGPLRTIRAAQYRARRAALAAPPSDHERPAPWQRSSLRQGLPGDGRPTSLREAYANCPHSVVEHRIVADTLYTYPGAVYVQSRVSPIVGPHTCVWGWEL